MDECFLKHPLQSALLGHLREEILFGPLPKRIIQGMLDLEIGILGRKMNSQDDIALHLLWMETQAKHSNFSFVCKALQMHLAFEEKVTF